MNLGFSPGSISASGEDEFLRHFNLTKLHCEKTAAKVMGYPDKNNPDKNKMPHVALV
jgi:hypothetical protein